MQEATPSILDMPRETRPAENILEDGDIVLVMGINEKMRMFTVGIDSKTLSADPADWSPDKLDAFHRSQKMFALAFAAGHPVLMNILLEITSDPTVVDFEKVKQLASVN